MRKRIEAIIPIIIFLFYCCSCNLGKTEGTNTPLVKIESDYQSPQDEIAGKSRRTI